MRRKNLRVISTIEEYLNYIFTDFGDFNVNSICQPKMSTLSLEIVRIGFTFTQANYFGFSVFGFLNGLLKTQFYCIKVYKFFILLDLTRPCAAAAEPSL